jgi:putative peptide zinc metalloprotease protein
VADAILSRRLEARRRPDLRFCPAPGSSSAWLVEDPLASRYYELPAEEMFLLRQFDGRASSEEICRRFARAFAPRRIDPRQLADFMRRAYGQGLLTSPGSRQGESLYLRAGHTRATRVKQALLNPLAVRLPGVDPEPLLARLSPLGNFVWSRSFLLLVGAVLTAALYVVVLRAADLRAELQAATTQFSAHTLWSLAVVTLAVKCVHELAHAVACRRLGGNCREIGVMLLVGMPCLYCDVTSVWMIPERWKRILVGAAGMLTEVIIAGAAVLLWNASGPGRFHDLCLQTAVVCSVATLLFNGNPLLRYDGYFILTDLLGTTNLGERSDAELRRRVAGFFAGHDDEDLSARPKHAWAWAGYAMASLVYRVVLTFAIWWFLRGALARFGLSAAADVVLAVSLFGMTVGPVKRAGRFTTSGLRDGSLDARRFTARSLAIVALLAAALVWPMPYRVAAPAAVRSEGGRNVFVATGGRLVVGKVLGESVAAGDVVARLDNLEMDRKLDEAAREVIELRKSAESLERRRIEDPAAGAALPATQAAVAAAEASLAKLKTEHNRLTIFAPCEGVVLPLPQNLAKLAVGQDDWQADPGDSPLSPARRGRYLAAGTPLCTIGPAQRREALLVVEQSDAEFVRNGAEVKLQFDAAGSTPWHGRVVESTLLRPEDAPDEIVAAGLIEMQNAADGPPRPKPGMQLVRVSIDDAAEQLPIGAVGQARISAASQSLARRGLRFFAETFRTGERNER